MTKSHWSSPSDTQTELEGGLPGQGDMVKMQVLTTSKGV